MQKCTKQHFRFVNLAHDKKIIELQKKRCVGCTLYTFASSFLSFYTRTTGTSRFEGGIGFRPSRKNILIFLRGSWGIPKNFLELISLEPINQIQSAQIQNERKNLVMTKAG